MICPECGETATAVFDDPQLGEQGSYTIVCMACPAELYVPAETTARTRIEAVREISRSGMAARVDGYIVDIQTANLLVKVYDALSPTNRERFGIPNLARLVNIAWKAAR